VGAGDPHTYTYTLHTESGIMGRISVKFAGSLAAVAVAGLGVTVALVGPFAVNGPADVIVTDKPCGMEVAGCFNPNRPNQIQVVPDAREAVIAHENLHRRLYGEFNPRWNDECYVSALLYEETGLRDGYDLLGLCD
jgi:hypothetical protein